MSNLDKSSNGDTKQIIEPAISFKLKDNTTPLMEIFPNGDFFVKGNLVENDKEVFQAFKQWLILSGMISEETNG